MEKLLPTTSLYDFNSDFGHLGFPKSESWNIFLASSNICIRDISNLFVLHPQFGFLHQQLWKYIALLIPRAHRIETEAHHSERSRSCRSERNCGGSFFLVPSP